MPKLDKQTANELFEAVHKARVEIVSCGCTVCKSKGKSGKPHFEDEPELIEAKKRIAAVIEKWKLRVLAALEKQAVEKSCQPKQGGCDERQEAEAIGAEETGARGEEARSIDAVHGADVHSNSLRGGVPGEEREVGKDAEFESKHARDRDGKFTSGEGSGEKNPIAALFAANPQGDDLDPIDDTDPDEQKGTFDFSQLTPAEQQEYNRLVSEQSEYAEGKRATYDYGRLDELEIKAFKPDSKQDQTGSPEFKAWFGDSKVVTPDGKPLVVYHGTDKMPTEFDASQRPELHGMNRAIVGFFTNSQENAETYARSKAAYHTEGTDGKRGKAYPGMSIAPIYLSFQNPLVVDAQGKNFSAVPFEGKKRNRPSVEDLATIAIARGHDSLIVRNVVDSSYGYNKPTDTYAAFSPTQIKSAVGNRGTFDPKEKDITKSFDPAQPRDEDGKWVHVMHGTTQGRALDRIIKEGIQKQAWHNFDANFMYGDRTKKVFVSTSRDMARHFAEIASMKLKGDTYGKVTPWAARPVIVEADIPSEEFKRLAEKDDALEREETAFMMPEVKPEWITAVTAFNPPSHDDVLWERARVAKSNLVRVFVPVTIAVAQALLGEKIKEKSWLKKVWDKFTGVAKDDGDMVPYLPPDQRALDIEQVLEEAFPNAGQDAIDEMVDAILDAQDAGAADGFELVAENLGIGDAEATQALSEPLQNALNDYALEFSESTWEMVNDSIKDLVADAMGMGATTRELSNAIEDKFTDLTEYESTRIARTEYARGQVFAAVDSYQKEGIELGRFENTSDSCDICAGYDQRIWPLEDILAAFPPHPHCRCYVSPVYELTEDEEVETEPMTDVFTDPGLSRDPWPTLEEEQSQKEQAQLGKSETIAKFSPDQRRDERGRWTDGGGLGTGAQVKHDLTNTPQFKQWFGGSKVVDGSGKPLVVFHANTFGDFSEFTKAEQRFGKAGYGFYFSDTDGANLFADYGMKFQHPTSYAGEPNRVKVYPVYLKMEHPLILDHVDDLTPYLDKGQKFGVARGVFGNLSTDAKTKLQERGYDGIITRETTAHKVHPTGGLKILPRGAEGAKSFPLYVVFEPSQIKSAIGNSGEFSPHDADITKANPYHDEHGRFTNAEDAVAFADAMVAEQFKDVKRSDGTPYKSHLDRVAAQLKDPHQKLVAKLHDSVEDGKMTLGEVEQHFGKRVAIDVDSVTRRSGETYAKFITRVAQNPNAVPVKLADLRDNMKTCSASMLERYTKAVAELEAIRKTDAYAIAEFVGKDAEFESKHPRGEKGQFAAVGAVSASTISSACNSQQAVDLLADIFNDPYKYNTPMLGGCRVAAEAILKLRPDGELYAIVDDRGMGASKEAQERFKESVKSGEVMVQHYIVKVGDNKYIDANGESSFEDIQKWFKDSMAFCLSEYWIPVPATPQIVNRNRGIQCPPGAAERFADFIRNHGEVKQ